MVKPLGAAPRCSSGAALRYPRGFAASPRRQSDHLGASHPTGRDDRMGRIAPGRGPRYHRQRFRRGRSGKSDLVPLRHGRSPFMALVSFTPNIQRHVDCPDTEADGASVREVLDKVFAENPRARTYVLDDQAALRKHMTIFVDGQIIRDRARLSDRVDRTSRVFVYQALSGG
jgi:hypothetical protein